MTSIANKINQLRDELRKHNYSYYVLDNPTISDFEFDTKLKTLQDLENQYPVYFDSTSPTQRIGGEVTKNFDTVKHDHRMYSLDNSYSREDILAWEIRLQKILGEVEIEYACELK